MKTKAAHTTFTTSTSEELLREEVNEYINETVGPDNVFSITEYRRPNGASDLHCITVWFRTPIPTQGHNLGPSPYQPRSLPRPFNLGHQ